MTAGTVGGHGDWLHASPWIARFAPMLGSGHRVLDVACGGGRHARLFAERGCRVTAVDRDAALLAPLQADARITAVVADLEAGQWPFAEAAFDAVIVTNYLYRPLFPSLLGALAPEGLMLYETFAVGNAAFGKPSNPEFLLRPRELLDLTATLRVVAFEDGFSSVPRPAIVQRIAARRHDALGALPIELAAL